ncbi:MAG: PLP-dependent lyase/thiolase [bacterium]|nr:PLP-dependent lyase/thiolase [bacterium]
MITPQTEHPELAKIIGVPRLYFKREDLHPYGSHKGRSIPVMIDTRVSAGKTHFAISSSGNAALAAVRYIQEKNNPILIDEADVGKTGGESLSLSIFIGENMNPEKKKKLLAEIRDKKIITIETARPLQALTKSGIESLRQSTDPTALYGYKTLAKELLDMSGTPKLSDIFIGTSSGTTAQALADYFMANKKEIAVHIVQPIDNSPIAREFDTEKREPEISIADAIVDKVAHRKEALVDAIQKTGGAGWVVSNDEIKRAQKLLAEKADIYASPNGALSLAGLMRAISKGRKFRGSVVCVITGQ